MVLYCSDGRDRRLRRPRRPRRWPGLPRRGHCDAAPAVAGQHHVAPDAAQRRPPGTARATSPRSPGPNVPSGRRSGSAMRKGAASSWPTQSLEGASRVEARAWFARGEAEHACGCAGSPMSTPPTSAALVAAWRASVAAFERIGHVFEIARCQARLAAVLHAAGAPAEARALVAAARATARRLGPSRSWPSCARWPGRAAGATSASGDRGRPDRPRAGDPRPRRRRAGATARSGASCSSAPRRSACTSPTSWPSSAPRGRTEAVAIARRRGVLQD